ncbi:MAG: nickel transporter [Verrucomicrobia bacterium]|nr:nickel transporter [Verrucomicrobiota bacterium]
MFLALLAGLLAGCVHVFTGPDHLAAVAPLSVGRARAWRTGAAWGLGHGCGVVLLGGVALAFRGLLPVDWISSWSERLIGLVLIGMGLWCLRLALSRRVHDHAHDHGGRSHSHFHVHTPGSSHPVGSQPPHRHTHAALVIGALHGFAGGAHLVGVVPALAFPAAGDAAGFLAGYGIGTVLAMSAFAAGVERVSRGSATRWPPGYRMWIGACGVTALSVGCCWAFLG